MIRVATWNIWGGKKRFEVIQDLKSISFDVLALQEVTEREVNGKIENDAAIIARELGLEYTYAKAFRTDRHSPVYDMGNAILSKCPIVTSKVHELSTLSTYEKNAATEPRIALEACIQLKDKTVTVISTHLGYTDDLTNPTELQKQQLNKLLSSVPKTQTILMGDFNSLPESEIIHSIEINFKHAAFPLTHPTWTNLKKENLPQWRIDYIFSSQDLRVESSEVIDTSASDHRILKAEIQL